MSQTQAAAMARCCLQFVAILLGYDEPALEFELRAVLADSDDRSAARQVSALARTRRREYADHQPLVDNAARLMKGEALPADASRVLASTALHAIRSLPARLLDGVEVQGTSHATAIDDAYRALQRHDYGKAARLLATTAKGAPPALGRVLLGIAEVYDHAVPSDEIIERLPAPRRSAPPPDFDLDRGRKSRADLVMAVLRAHDIQLRDVERGRLRPVTRDDLAEAILRDPFWDDIDASVQEDGVVDRILREGAPSPAIDLSAFGQSQVYIKRIVR